jgi:hypothetical protein
VSFLHQGFEVVTSVLPCKRGIAPRIAVAEHYSLCNARAVPTLHGRATDQASGRRLLVYADIERANAG